MALESGTLTGLRYVREAVQGVTPAAVATPVTNIASAAGSAGFGEFTRSAGSFIDDGFVVGHRVLVAGFAAGAHNGTWLVTGVAAGTLTVYDPTDAIGVEAAEAGQTVRILMMDLRLTERPANVRKEMLRSREVRTDRQVADLRHGYTSGESAPGYEWSLAAFDDLLAFEFGREWAAVPTVSGVNLGIDSGTKILDRASGSWITDGYRPGDIIAPTGFVNSPNNGQFTVLAVTALNLTLSDPNNVIVTEAAAGGRTVTYPGKRLDVGVILHTFTLEQVFGTIGKYRPFKGMAMNTMALGVVPNEIVGGTFGVLGMLSLAAMVSSPLSSVDPYPKPTYSPFAAFDGRLYEGASLIAVATSLNFDGNNNRTGAPVIGSKFTPAVFEGDFVLNGEMVAFVENETLINKFINESESSLFLRLQDPTTPTDFMSVVLPRIKYTGADINPPQRGPVPVTMPFAALVKTLASPSGGSVNSCITLQRSNP